MAGSFNCVRQLVIEKPADQVWAWLSDIRNSMTSNQFHVGVDCTESEALHPTVGMDVPILHEYLDGSRFYRTARIMTYKEYELSWAERVPDDCDYEDSFPHGEGWKVEAAGANQCLVSTSLYGSFRLPLGELVGQIAWDMTIPTVLDNDLYDVAYGVGAMAEHKRIEIPPIAAAWLRFANAREIDGIPAADFLKLPRRHGKRQS